MSRFETNFSLSRTNLSTMTKIVDLQTYRTRALEQRGFGPWQNRFGESFDSTTRIVDLSDSTLYYLAQPGESSSVAYYEFIMGILDLGAAPKFHYLGNRDQMMVVDIHLFLADQMRFEMMRRLEWIRTFEGGKYSLLEMVQEFENSKNKMPGTPAGFGRVESRLCDIHINLPSVTRRCSSVGCCKRHLTPLRKGFRNKGLF